MDETSKEIIKQATGVLTEAYKDGLSPSIQPIGTVLSYLPRTIRLAFSKWEKWIINGEESLKLTGELLKEKIVHIPEENLCEPELYVAIPTIQQISYCENSKDLRNLYANLLYTSMNIETKSKVHPAFIDIIKQLTPDEAKILNVLAPISMITYPLIDVEITHLKEGGFNTVTSNFTDIGLNVIDNKTDICAYIDNLERLKLIEIDPSTTLQDQSIYDKLIENDFIKNIVSESVLNHYALDYVKKTFRVTSFGANFLKVCCQT